MHPRVDSLPVPRPDFRTFLDAVGRRNRGRIPMIELAVDCSVAAALLDEPVPRPGGELSHARAVAQSMVRLHHRMGYDVVKVSAPIPFDVPRLKAAATQDARQWQNPHQGVVRTAADLERFRWPAPTDVDFGPLEAATAVLPDGMALIGFCGGVLEFTTDILGLEHFMFAVYDDPDLVAAVLDGVGRTLLSVFETYGQMESVCALWLGDDLGSRNGTLVSPDWLKENVFPWYRRFVELAHRHGKPFLLHSCGNLEAVLPCLIHEIGIDAKHSFEDTILPVEQFLDRFGDSVATLGGIDMNLLAQGPEDAIRARTRRVLEHAAPGGGYACGSGNSIPNYIPPAHYLAMVETVADFNAP